MQLVKINIQTTSNPKILKFEASKFLTQHTSYEYGNIDEAKNSPLAQSLFHLPFVKKVYIASNFVAVERYDIVEWDDVKQEVSQLIEAYINSDKKIITQDNDLKIKKAITVYAESTPNPSVLKFVSNKILVNELYEFLNIEDSKPSPLATGLFQFPFVKHVFMEKNYISVTKYDVVEWNEITNELREFIRNFITEGNSIINANASKQLKKTEEHKDTKFEKLDDISKQIVNILEEYVKPAVASDGGNIEFKYYNHQTKKVEVLLQGACSGCPSSTFTLKNGIETMLRDMLNDNEITVSAINN